MNKKQMSKQRMAYQDEDMNGIESVSFDKLTEKQKKAFKKTEF